MRSAPRLDDFEQRRTHLRGMTDDELHEYFWELAGRLVAPLVEEARSHTTPSIERSVLLRMGLSSLEAKDLVERFAERRVLGHGAGALLLGLALAHGVSPREAALGLLEGRWWDEVQP
ncbi:MAG TPA: D-ornithine 4,5-aminomutase subunit OraS [Acidimicrobiales bacterium]